LKISQRLLDPLNLPSFPFKLKTSTSKTLIFDELRKKFIVLTPEEWVRQHLVQYLIRDLDYPRSLIKLESGLFYHKMPKRSDILIFKRNGSPLMVVECKGPKIALNRDTFYQVATYNATLKADYLTISNGLNHFCCKIDYETNDYQFLTEIPGYESIAN